MTVPALMDIGNNQYVPLFERVGNSYLNITTNATTLVHSGVGTLFSISVNTKGASSSSIKIYDSLTASGTVIATIDSVNFTGTLPYDLIYTTGLTVVTSGGTPADITVIYR